MDREMEIGRPTTWGYVILTVVIVVGGGLALILFVGWQFLADHTPGDSPQGELTAAGGGLLIPLGWLVGTASSVAALSRWRGLVTVAGPLFWLALPVVLPAAATIGLSLPGNSCSAAKLAADQRAIDRGTIGVPYDCYRDPDGGS